MITAEKIKRFFFDDDVKPVTKIVNKNCMNCNFYAKDLREYGTCSSKKFNNFVRVEYKFIDIEPAKLQEVKDIRLIRVHPNFGCAFWKSK